MIRTLKGLPKGKYIADFRVDEGIRIREEFIAPTIHQGLGGGGGITRMILVIINDED